MATVVHDPRGNASVEWQDAPADFERPVLEILEDAPPSPSREHGFDPYATNSRRARGPDPYGCEPERQRRLAPPAREPTPKSNDVGRRPRTDLRKLSEWIKMMRELEARKKSGGESDEGNDKG